MIARKAAATTQNPAAGEMRPPVVADPVTSAPSSCPGGGGAGFLPAPPRSPALLYAAHTGRVEAGREREGIAQGGRPRRAADRLGELGGRAVDPLGQRLHVVVRVAPV